MSAELCYLDLTELALRLRRGTSTKACCHAPALPFRMRPTGIAAAHR
jgi:hypothetical protein